MCAQHLVAINSSAHRVMENCRLQGTTPFFPTCSPQGFVLWHRVLHAFPRTFRAHCHSTASLVLPIKAILSPVGLFFSGWRSTVCTSLQVFLSTLLSTLSIIMSATLFLRCILQNWVPWLKDLLAEQSRKCASPALPLHGPVYIL